MELRTRVQPAKTASASEIDGREGLKAGSVGMSWLNSLAFEAAPSVIPALRLSARAHTGAIPTDQSVLITPLVALAYR